MKMETNLTIPVYLEVGQKKVVAGAIDWPGWCRIAKTPEAALQALFEYAPRYARVLAPSGLEFQLPQAIDQLQVVEELPGTATTDFGAPDKALDEDHRSLEVTSLARLLAILESCWQAFEAAVQAAAGKALRSGPRGGGRDRIKIQEHVLGAEQAYLGKLAWKYKKPDETDLPAALQETRRQARLALEAGLRGELPEAGPRGGTVWPPRYFVRRSAWHVLDHAWEIEDRIEE